MVVTPVIHPLAWEFRRATGKFIHAKESQRRTLEKESVKQVTEQI